MATKRTRRTHGRTLDEYTKTHLLLLTGATYWTPEETERFRAAWHQHGRQLLDECERGGRPQPMALGMFGPPEAVHD